MFNCNQLIIVKKMKKNHLKKKKDSDLKLKICLKNLEKCISFQPINFL